MAKLTAVQVLDYARSAGFPDSALPAAVAYAYIESAFVTDAVSKTGCVGLWQICPPPADAADPAANARYAYGKWSACNGGSFACDWDPYDLGTGNPAYAAGLALGQTALASSPAATAGLPQPATLGFPVIVLVAATAAAFILLID